MHNHNKTNSVLEITPAPLGFTDPFRKTWQYLRDGGFQRWEGYTRLTEAAVEAVGSDTSADNDSNAGQSKPAPSPDRPGPELPEIYGDENNHGSVCARGPSFRRSCCGHTQTMRQQRQIYGEGWD